MDGTLVAEAARRLRTGDPAGLQDLAALLGPSLAAYLGQMLRDREAARDLLQELWLKVWIHRESLRDPARVKPWLYAIARREALMRLRSGGRDIAGLEADALEAPTPDPAALVVRTEEREAVLARFAALDPARREILWLAVVEAIPHAEIARILDIPEGTCRSRLHHALAALRAAMGDGKSS